MADDETLGAYNIFDLREMALRRVPKGLFEFVDRGTEDGEAGATRAITLFREEISRVMALLGVRSVEELGPELLHFADGAFRRHAQPRADLKLLDTARAAEG